jgi:hypothetical protein
MASKGIENLIKDALANGCHVVRSASLRGKQERQKINHSYYL